MFTFDQNIEQTDLFLVVFYVELLFKNIKADVNSIKFKVNGKNCCFWFLRPMFLIFHFTVTLYLVIIKIWYAEQKILNRDPIK